MTASELIEALQKMPGDTRVVVNGYEGGVDDVDEVRAVKVVLNAYEPQKLYYGSHAIEDEGIPAVLIA
jgi:hypothetical protein